jgi:hypothetical protein
MESAEFPEKKIHFQTFEPAASRGERAAETRAAAGIAIVRRSNQGL